MTLETDRLRLCPFRASDGDSLFAIVGDRAVMRFSFPMSRRESDDFLTNFLLRRFPIGYALEERSRPGLAGYILFHQIEPRVWELGWFLRRDVWGKRYAQEISAALLERAFHGLDGEKVVAETTDPLRAGALLTSLGFVRTGAQPVTDCLGAEAELAEYELTAEMYRHGPFQ